MGDVKNKTYGQTICLLSVIAFLVSCTPMLGKPKYYIMVAVVSTLFLILQFGKGSVKNNSTMLIVTVLYVFLILGYRLARISSAEWGNYMEQLLFFIPYFLMLLTIDISAIKQRRIAFWIMLLIGVFNLAYNIYLNILYPGLIDYVHSFEAGELSSMNYGGSHFFVFSLFFFNVCFFVFLNTVEKKEKTIIGVVLLVTIVYIIGFCGKGSIVIYLLLSVVAQYYAKKTKDITIFVIVMVLLVLTYFIIMYLFKDTIVNLIISYAPNERVAIRLVGLIDEDNTYGSTLSLEARETLYMMSINTWLHDLGTFLFGIGDHRGHGMSELVGIGQHSDFLDNLARYGLLGAVLLFVILKNIFKFILSLFDKELRFQVFIILSVFLLCGFTKDLFSSTQSICIFLLLPLSTVLVNKQK